MRTKGKVTVADGDVFYEMKTLLHVGSLADVIEEKTINLEETGETVVLGQNTLNWLRYGLEDE